MAATDVISLGLVDFKGRTGNFTCHILAGFTDAEIVAFCEDLAEYVDNNTGCQVLDCQVTKSISLAGALGLKGAPTAGLDFEKGGNIGFDVTDSDYRYTVRIPAINEAVVVGDQLDLGDPILSAFTQVMLLGTGTVQPTNRDGLDLASVLSGVVTFHKSK